MQKFTRRSALIAAAILPATPALLRGTPAAADAPMQGEVSMVARSGRSEIALKHRPRRLPNASAR